MIESTPKYTSQEIPLEEMTQPMGPLQEGDQALVDAVNKLPEGEHVVAGQDGSFAAVEKEKGPATTIVTTRTTEAADGSVKETNALIHKLPLRGGITTKTIYTEVPGPDSRGRGEKSTTLETIENQVAVNFGELTKDRERAQQVKLDAAGKIDTVREKVEEASTGPDNRTV
ncbi:MAG TPA: hypothetical protein VD947_04320 [Patescibacteria group bacterium]|nr:hypothetical protein [Patescibacteria group bacterium]